MPVKGGRDMTLSNFFNFETIQTDAGPTVQVPRGMMIENYLLEFCKEWDTGGPIVNVPLTSWEEHDEVIGIWAPELQQEGGVRGLKADPPLKPGEPLPEWQPPFAPNRPSSDPYKSITEIEADVRKRTSWGFTPLRSLGGLSRLRRRSSQRVD
ncbi:MAG TPA: hypothetical protein VHJ78_11645 [Actinomycetota bacterium]|nr:hypothetical protein [Actinomycetota bacterium]